MLTKELLEKKVATFEKIVRNGYTDLSEHRYFSTLGINVLSNNDINNIGYQSSECLEKLNMLIPSFQNLDIDILKCLITTLYEKSNVEKKWAEKLLLFLETRHKDLNPYMNEKFAENFDKEWFLAVLTSYIIEHGFIYNDLRFLNISLKIIELLKFYNTKYILSLTNSNRLSQNIALIHIKNLQLITIQLERL